MPRFLILFLAVLATFRIAHAETVRIGGTGSALPFLSAVARDFNATAPDTPVTVLPSLGSSGAIRALAAGIIEIAVSARALTAEETALGLVQQRWGWTPLVFVAQPHALVQTVTTDQLAAIYGGTLTQWANGHAIRPILRPPSDSEPALVVASYPELAPAFAAAHKQPGRIVAITDSDATDHMEHIPDAFGLSTMLLLASERRSLVPLSLNGAAPSLAAVEAGHYRLVKPLFIITRREPPPSVAAFVAVLRSDTVRRQAAELHLRLE